MKNLESYAMKILADSGCDMYTYGNDGQEKHLLNDLREAFPDGMEFPYIDVANAILSISRPRPIVKHPYMVTWENENDCDGYGVESFEAARTEAEDTLIGWMMESINDSDDDWNYMIYNCGVSVQKYNPANDKYEECWTPNYDELKAIGWEERLH